MVVDNRGILPASYSISSVRHALRASAGVIDIDIDIDIEVGGNRKPYWLFYAPS